MAAATWSSWDRSESVTVRFWAVAGALELVVAPVVVLAGAEDAVDEDGFDAPVDVVRADVVEVVEAVEGWLGLDEQAARMHEATTATPTPVNRPMGPAPRSSMLVPEHTEVDRASTGPPALSGT